MKSEKKFLTKYLDTIIELSNETGMSKKEVISAMGKPPTSSSLIEKREYLFFYNSWDGGHYVELADGKVTGYGIMRDYKDPRKRKATRLEIDQNIRKEIIKN